jgi:hypothetical protein
MTWLLTLITKLLGSTLLEKVASILEKRADAQVAMRTSDNVTGAAVAASILQAEIETNKIKVANNIWWGAKVIILSAGIPASAHMGAVFLDSMFHFEWSIAKIPAPCDGYQRDIVLSFFILAPTMKLVDAVSLWLRK